MVRLVEVKGKIFVWRVVGRIELRTIGHLGSSLRRGREALLLPHIVPVLIPVPSLSVGAHVERLALCRGSLSFVEVLQSGELMDC